MTLSRKDYQVIANLIVIAKEQYPQSTIGIEALTMMLTGAFGTSNPSFRHDLFLIAAEHPEANSFLKMANN